MERKDKQNNSVTEKYLEIAGIDTDAHQRVLPITRRGNVLFQNYKRGNSVYSYSGAANLLVAFILPLLLGDGPWPHRLILAILFLLGFCHYMGDWIYGLRF